MGKVRDHYGSQGDTSLKRVFDRSMSWPLKKSWTGLFLYCHRTETVKMPIKCAWNVPDLLALGRRIRLPGPAGESEGSTSVSV